MFKQIYSYASAARLFTLNPMSRDFSNPEGNPSYSPPPPPPRTPLPPLPPPSPHLRHHHHNHHCFRHMLLYLFHSFDASHVTRHTSHVARHTSHVTRHTSHVTHLLHHQPLPCPSGPVFASALTLPRVSFQRLQTQCMSPSLLFTRVSIWRLFYSRADIASLYYARPRV
jgi:hypothetical protein